MSSMRTETLVFHYDRTEKFYLGCDFAIPCPETNEPMVPGDATLIEPPETWPKGSIPVFDGQRWNVVKDDFWRPKFIVTSYNSGRDMETWAPKAISIWSFPHYPEFIRLTTSFSVISRLVESIRYVDDQFLKLIALHKQIIAGVTSPIEDVQGGRTLVAKPTPFARYKLDSESIVFHVRHCLDTLCRLTELLVCADQVNREHRFRCDSVGALFGQGKTSLTANIVRGLGPDFEKDDSDFLVITNELFNAIKHTHMNAETGSLFCPDLPTIVAFSAPFGKHAETITIHNHNAYHFIMGFHDTIDRILLNQKTWLSNNTNR